ncbi:hypothetical protein [Paenibacillus sp. 1001270B_150601_E10]|uniref:hypothetical protein n=1 Tax=Paenibacillus sp. 1001270B_150601_E10 TaxID=2787079 RepID=UPI00189FB727|nr:hypothetical protein [Paenibacillus sp. 1001270B_150601_E10]
MLERQRPNEKTSFQEIHAYEPAIDLQTDMVMVYGIDDTMEARIKGWKEEGYTVGLMTGTAWGEYQPYLNGHVDGIEHWEEAQTRANGTRLIHETDDVPYMVPTVSFSEYITKRLMAAVDAGVEAFFMEEPEFWVEGGYSEAFKREWELFYQEPWMPPHQSPDAQYRASKLKAHLYAQALDRISTAVKSYAKHVRRKQIRFFIPTHSLINYCQWRIVSPESKLMELDGIDGYIAQVWTGTSRVPNVYQGKRKERTFETAYLEYGIMQELVRGSDRRMWFLHDPIEDHPGHTWEDYESNYKKTVVASLLHPHINHYEVTPWPHRIYKGAYAKEGCTDKQPLPEAYGTILLSTIHMLQQMPLGGIVGTPEQVLSAPHVHNGAKKQLAQQPSHSGKPHQHVGTGRASYSSRPEIGVLVADSAMYQRLDLSLDWENVDEETRFASEMEHITWDGFFGLAMPLLKQGYPVRPVQLDNVRRIPHYLTSYQVLLLSYEYMKPETMDLHYGLAQWVQSGGILLYIGDGCDPYHSVREWWNKGESPYESPAHHLFETLGLDLKALSEANKSTLHSVGKGGVICLHESPAAFTRSAEDAARLVRHVAEGWTWKHGSGEGLEPSHALVAKRGPYLIAAVLEESVSEEPLVLQGRFVNLFDGNLSAVTEWTVAPGEQALLYDLNEVNPHEASEPVLVAAAGRVTKMSPTSEGDAKNIEMGGLHYQVRGPEGVRAVLRFSAAAPPAKVIVRRDQDELPCTCDWDASSSTFAVAFMHPANGAELQLIYK